MKLRIILAIVAVFVCWTILDYVIHGILLGSAYEETEHLWRPMEQMKMGLMRVVSIISAGIFVLIYSLFFKQRNMKTALLYSVLYGFGYGISVGYGSFSVMPIPYLMAFIWCWGTFIQFVVAGVLVGLIIKN